MKKIKTLVFTFIFFALIQVGRAQCSNTCGTNLIPNPSFETATSFCNNTDAQIYLNQSPVANWFGTEATTSGVVGSTPDYGSPCASIINSANNVCVTGTSRVGFFTRTSFAGGREYVQAALTSPLVAGKTYCFAMTVKSRVGAAGNLLSSCDGVGAWFHDQGLIDIDAMNAGQQFIGPGSNVNGQPQVENPSGNLIGAACVTVSGTFCAMGNEEYVIIGNFRDDANTQISGSNPNNYMYIDDLSLFEICSTPLEVDVVADVSNVCPGSCAAITSTASGLSGSYTYLWQPSGATAANITVCPSVTTTYTLTTTSQSACGLPQSVTDTITITVSSCSPQVIATGGEICSGTCIPISANAIGGSGTITYTWQPGNLTGASAVVCPNVSTIYTVTATDETGNTFTDTCLVSIIQNPVVDAGADVIICEGSSATLTASGIGTYSWSTSPTQTTQSVVVSPAITMQYTLTLTNGSCSSSDVVSVIVTPVPVADAGFDTTICEGSSVTLTASGVGAYLWSTSPLQTTQSIVVSPAATTQYTLTVTNGNCSSRDSVIVNVNSLPLANAGSDVTICEGSSATLAGIASGIISWNTVPPQNNQTIVVAPSTTTNYILTVTSGLCISTDEVTVFVEQIPVANAGNDIAICVGSGATLTGNGTGSSFAWNTTPAQTTQSIVVSPVVTTQYVLTVSNGSCFSSDTVEVIVTEIPLIQIDKQDVSCFGLSNGSATATITGGVQPFSFSWNPGAINANSISALSVGDYTFTVTDAVGCIYTQTVSVLQPAPVVPQILGATQLCAGESTSLTAQVNGGNSGYNYNWHGSGPNASMILVSPTATTNYLLTVTDPLGCVGEVGHLISVNNPPNAMFIGGDTLCVPFNVSFTNQSQNAVVYTWLFGDGGASNFENPTHGYNTAGNFNVSLIAESANGCRDTFTINNAVNAVDLPINTITSSEYQVSEYDPTIILNFESSNSINCNVDFGDGMNVSLCEASNYLHTFKDTGSFCIVFTSENILGCKSTSSTCIKVLPEFEFYVPNSFTPDGDGINDFFTGYGVNFTDFSLQIFNRWGEKIYESADYEKPWDGLAKNKSSVSQVDVYVYRIQLKDAKGAIKVYTGNVNLIR